MFQIHPTQAMVEVDKSCLLRNRISPCGHISNEASLRMQEARLTLSELYVCDLDVILAYQSDAEYSRDW